MNKNPPKSFNIYCPHFKQCSGCTVDEAVHLPLVLTEARDWFSQHGIEDFQLHAGKAVGWRMRAKLAVRGTPQQPLIGLFKEGTHHVVDIPQCKVHHPAINRAVNLVKETIKHHHLSLYDEEAKTGDLRYLQFIVERSTGRVHVTFVLNFSPEEQSKSISWREILKELWKHQDGLFWHSFSVNFNTRRDNVIFSPLWDLWFGEAFLWENFLGVPVCFKPSSFAQANLDQFEVLLKIIQRWVPQQTKVAEYYAGVGVIGLALTSQCERVLCNEIEVKAGMCFEESKKKLPAELQSKITWYQGRSDDFVDWLDSSDVVIVDPPRKGIEARLMKHLKAVTRRQKLIYMSCGWHSFKKDAALLMEAGWQLKAAEGHLFFPGSNHIETLALFEK